MISEFKEIPLNEIDYQVKAHPSHDTSDLEMFNVVN